MVNNNFHCKYSNRSEALILFQIYCICNQNELHEIIREFERGKVVFMSNDQKCLATYF